jgi:malate dehydrogenase (oxaloacetate-decarboxylating)(NADP+)
MGLPVDNITLTDIKGVVHKDRGDAMAPNMARYARKTDARTLGEVLAGADVFLGLSAPNVLKPEWLPQMARKPLILALANPDPEIMPEVAKAARPDAIIATGRSDYVNQVNNVLCFPFVFRGALDVDATTINEPMKVAAVEAIAALARVEASDVVANAYGGAMTGFGPDNIIPKPFDPRLILHIAPAVARAAMGSGVARRPIVDFDAYENELEKFVYRSGQLMRPVFDVARRSPRRVVYAEGEEERTLRAVQTVVDEGLAHPTLIGRRDVILKKTGQLGLRLDFSKDARILDPLSDKEFFAPLTERYQRMVERRGVQPDSAARWLATRHGIAAAMLLDAGEVDAALCGGLGDWTRQLTNIMPIIPRQHGVTRLYSLSALILPKGALFFCDTHVNVDPTAEQIAEMTLLAAKTVRRFGLAPKAALLSHSSFGASQSPSAIKMRKALSLLRASQPDFELEGEMHADAALSESLRSRIVSSSPLTGSANLLVMPTLDAANIALTLLSAATEALLVGPMLLGVSKPVHVMVPSVTARGIVNMTALAVAQAAATSAAPAA